MLEVFRCNEVAGCGVVIGVGGVHVVAVCGVVIGAGGVQM